MNACLSPQGEETRILLAVEAMIHRLHHPGPRCSRIHHPCTEPDQPRREHMHGPERLRNQRVIRDRLAHASRRLYRARIAVDIVTRTRMMTFNSTRPSRHHASRLLNVSV